MLGHIQFSTFLIHDPIEEGYISIWEEIQQKVEWGTYIVRVRGERFMSGENEPVPSPDDWSVRVNILSCHPQALQYQYSVHCTMFIESVF